MCIRIAEMIECVAFFLLQDSSKSQEDHMSNSKAEHTTLRRGGKCQICRIASLQRCSAIKSFRVLGYSQDGCFCIDLVDDLFTI